MSEFLGCDALVTGGTGFIGSHLVRRLLNEGASVSVLVRDPAYIGRLEPLRACLKLIQGDICSSGSAADGRPGGLGWADLSDSGPQFVFHLAAYGVERPLDGIDDAIEANVRGTINLVSAAGHHWKRLRAFVYTGTDFEYGAGSGPRVESQALRPPNPYAASKASGWLMAHALATVQGLPLIGTRIFLSYGPDQGARRLVPSVVLDAIHNRDMMLSGGMQVRDFIFVEDVVEGLLSAAVTAANDSQCHGEIFNLGTGIGTPLREVVEMILDLTQSTARPQFGALPYRQGEIWELRADATKSQKALGWSSHTSLSDGLKRTIDWYRSNRGVRTTKP